MVKYALAAFYLLTSFAAMATDLTAIDADRSKQIALAMNQHPEEWIQAIDAKDVIIHQGVGRVEVNSKAKFSYYIQTENPADANSRIFVIPMSTSRYSPRYYQTDEWWDAHKQEIAEAKQSGKPQPHQDENEVTTWLAQMKLSTNPLVFIVHPGQAAETPRLQAFLLDYYLQHYAQNGQITLFRGGANDVETQAWLNHQHPKGVRYWTPTANYGWRYARKNSDFLTQMAAGRPELYLFTISVEQFKTLATGKHPRLTLGTELTKQVHQNFNSSGRFTDILFKNGDYMGIGDLGLEFEIRSSSDGTNAMIANFQHVVTPAELVRDRLTLLKKTLDRLLAQQSQSPADLQTTYEARAHEAVIEGEIFMAIQNKMSRETLQSLSDQISKSSPSEFGNIEGASWSGFMQTQLNAAATNPTASATELSTLQTAIPQSW